jgi:cytochrome c oxidase cbb3-type subunit 1
LSSGSSLERQILLHSLTWLVIANLVGMLLALLLLFPELGSLLGPFTYGRWLPLHLDLHLFGWCSLPLVGLLLRLYLPPEKRALGPLALGAWSGALAFGAISWLAGASSGKLFLEWTGAARIVFTASMVILALVLATGWCSELETYRRRRRSNPLISTGHRGLVAKGCGLAALAMIPAALYLAASPVLYPPINPDSGGATGGSLLGSTLGIVLLIGLVPLILGLRPDDGGRLARQTGMVFLAHTLGFALLDHGNRSHHEPLQVIALASLVIWWPLLVRHLRRFDWPASSIPWLRAFALWGVLLLATGIVSFLPGVLERWKFTNALVAHAHVAMAGWITSLNCLILLVMGRGATWARGLTSGRAFALWHSGCALLVFTLIGLGILEGIDPDRLFRQDFASTTLYSGRLLGGWMMSAASLAWLGHALSSTRRA